MIYYICIHALDRNMQPNSSRRNHYMGAHTHIALPTFAEVAGTLARMDATEIAPGDGDRDGIFWLRGIHLWP